jgi:hypothetical protein
MFMAIELDGFPDGRVLGRLLEEGELDIVRCLFFDLPHSLSRGKGRFTDCINDGSRVDALVDVEGNGGDFEGGVLGFAGPDKLGVEVGVVGVGFLADIGVSSRGNQTDGRVIEALLGGVFVGSNAGCRRGGLFSRHAGTCSVFGRGYRISVTSTWKIVLKGQAIEDGFIHGSGLGVIIYADTLHIQSVNRRVCIFD